MTPKTLWKSIQDQAFKGRDPNWIATNITPLQPWIEDDSFILFAPNVFVSEVIASVAPEIRAALPVGIRDFVITIGSHPNPGKLLVMRLSRTRRQCRLSTLQRFRRLHRGRSRFPSKLKWKACCRTSGLVTCGLCLLTSCEAHSSRLTVTGYKPNDQCVRKLCCSACRISKSG